MPSVYRSGVINLAWVEERESRDLSRKMPMLSMEGQWASARGRAGLHSKVYSPE